MEDEEDDRVFEVAKCGCDCWYCPDCCTRKGYTLRAELIPVLASFSGLMMLTLTIDPELFASPQEAYLYLREKRGISRLMRELDLAGHLCSRRYFYVVEFQRQTEQAHFHVLVDARRIPKPAIDGFWSRLRPPGAPPPAPNRPAFGMTRFTQRRFPGGAVHAGRYATKYLTKTPAHGWPAWVMAMGAERRVPRYQTSHKFWGRESTPATPTGATRTMHRQTYAQRIAECGHTCNVFEVTERINFETGEVHVDRSWLARLAVDCGVIAAISPGEGPARRVSITAATPRACIETIQAAAGHPVDVLSGLGAGRARP